MSSAQDRPEVAQHAAREPREIIGDEWLTARLAGEMRS